MLHRRAETGGLDLHVRAVLGHHHLGLHVGALRAELLVVVEHLDGPCLFQAPLARLPVQPLKEVVVLVHADGLPDGKDLLFRVLDQNHMVLIVHKCCSLHTEDVRLKLVDDPLLAAQLPAEVQPPLAQAGRSWLSSSSSSGPISPREKP